MEPDRRHSVVKLETMLMVNGGCLAGVSFRGFVAVTRENFSGLERITRSRENRRQTRWTLYFLLLLRAAAKIS